MKKNKTFHIIAIKKYNHLQDQQQVFYFTYYTNTQWFKQTFLAVLGISGHMFHAAKTVMLINSHCKSQPYMLRLQSVLAYPCKIYTVHIVVFPHCLGSNSTTVFGVEQKSSRQNTTEVTFNILSYHKYSI